MVDFDQMKVFSATKARDREVLGEKVTGFLRAFLARGGEVMDKVVTQSSDHEFHCISIILFLKNGVKK